MSAPDHYRRHAVPLSAAESALWDRPAAPESVTHQLAKVLRIADLDGAAVIGFDDGEMDAAYLRMAEAAVEHMAGRTS